MKKDKKFPANFSEETKPRHSQNIPAVEEWKSRRREKDPKEPIEFQQTGYQETQKKTRLSR